NGEINTLWGNRNAMRAREPVLASPVWREAVDRLKPVVWAEGSDSASLDNALELLVRSGRDPVHALMMLLPEAHEGAVELPAALVESGSLGPGELLVVDTRRKAVIRNAAAKHDVARRRPYASWGARAVRPLRPAVTPDTAPLGRAELAQRQLAFGFGFEDLRFVLEPMGNAGQDAVWSMGDDTPIPPLSHLPQSVYAFLRQRFAQVTNPPIDPLREGLVMSLRMHLGRRGSLLVDRPAGLRLVRLEHPVLLEAEMAALWNVAGVQAVTLPALWNPDGGPEALRS